jgi:hypothetical protein
MAAEEHKAFGQWIQNDVADSGALQRTDEVVINRSGTIVKGTGTNLSKFLGPWVNVIDYGADPTGVTACHVEIQAAIDAVGDAGGGVVYLPPGTYRATDVLAVMDSSVIVQGAGKGATQIFGDMDAKTILGWNGGGGGISYGGVRDLTLIGRQSAARTSGSGLYLANIGDFIAENLSIRDAYNGIVLDGANGCYVSDVMIDETVVGASYRGVQITNGSISNHFADVVVVGQNVGFYLDGGTDTATFYNCGVQKTATAIPTHGWQLNNTGGLHDPRWVRLTNCYAEVANAGAGYYVTKGYDVELTGCYASWGGWGVYVPSTASNVRVIGGLIQLCQQDGVFIQGANVLLQGTTISDCSQAGNNVASGVSVVAGATNWRIIGCRIGNPIWGGSTPSAGAYQHYGIDIASSGTIDQFAIIGNDLTGNNTSAIHFAGSVGSTFDVLGNAGSTTAYWQGKAVTYGANDSGGSGYKLLRVPN